MLKISKLAAVLAVVAAPYSLSAVLTLADLEGKYVSYGFSAGSIQSDCSGGQIGCDESSACTEGGGCPAPNAQLGQVAGCLGKASANISSSSYDANGNSTINFISYTTWDGCNAQTVSTNYFPAATPIQSTVTITYPQFNAGKSVIQNFLGQNNLTTDFVAKKNCKNCVEKIFTNATYIPGITYTLPITGATITISERTL